MKWFYKRLERSGVGIGLFAVAFLVLLPVLLPVLFPVAIVQHWMRTRTMLKVARNLACSVCGTPLGAEAISLAKERWMAMVADMQAKNPGVKFRLVRDVDAICTRCGREYQYRDADRSLILKPAAEASPANTGLTHI